MYSGLFIISDTRAASVLSLAKSACGGKKVADIPVIQRQAIMNLWILVITSEPFHSETHRLLEASIHGFSRLHSVCFHFRICQTVKFDIVKHETVDIAIRIGCKSQACLPTQYQYKGVVLEMVHL